MFWTRERTGEASVLTAATIWSLFPIVSIELLKELHPIFSGSISMFAAAIFFAVILTVKKRWSDIFRRDVWFELFMASLLIGVISYLLLFIGLQYTTAGNASIVGLMEVFFAYVFLGVLWKKEELVPMRILGAACMVLGAAIVLLPQGFSWQNGNWIVLLATMTPPFGNYFNKKAREKVSAECVMFVRSCVSCVFLFSLSLLIEDMPSAASFSTYILLLIVVNGFLLLGLSKIFWMESLHRIQVTKATSLASIGPVFTLFFVWALLKDLPTSFELLAIIPTIVGVYLLTKTKESASQELF